MRKPILSLLLLSLFITGHAQDIPAYPLPDSLIFTEKVYLHTDRTIYYSGDDVWFKAYLIDAAEMQLSGQSKNLHVELISPSSEIIFSRTVRLEDGLGNGDFRLPDNIKSGRYRIRAYTNFMRNFGDQLFFNKEITVINSKDEQTENAPVKYAENKIILSFFPEGGSLIDNVSSAVAFKAENISGKGCDITGKIFSANGDLITSFRSTHLGMGSFYLRPLPGLRYYSIYRAADSIDIRTDLPASFPAGVTLSASVSRNNEVIITTKTNQDYPAAHF